MIAKWLHELNANWPYVRPIWLLSRCCRGMNMHSLKDHFKRSLGYRYKVIYNWPTLMAMIPGAEATKASSMISDVLDCQSCSWAIGRSHMVAYLNLYAEYGLLHECVQVSYPTVMVIIMVSSKGKPPLMLPSWHKADTMIEDVTKITFSNSNNDQHLVWVSSVRLVGCIPDMPEVEIWSMVSLGIFLHSRLFTSILLDILTK